jgi:hypothetical protein
MPWLNDIYYAFTELGTCRGEGYIPWTAIDQYARAYGYDQTEEDYTRFLSLIRAMDNVYLKVIADRRKKMDEKNKKPLGNLPSRRR